MKPNCNHLEEIFNLTKALYPDAVMNGPVFRNVILNCVPYVSIPSLKILVEYSKADLERQQAMESLDWGFIRYRDYVPDAEQLGKDVGFLVCRRWKQELKKRQDIDKERS